MARQRHFVQRQLGNVAGSVLLQGRQGQDSVVFRHLQRLEAGLDLVAASSASIGASFHSCGSVQRENHDVSLGSCHFLELKTGLLECRHQSHVSVCRGLRVNRIGLDIFGPVVTRKFYGGRKKHARYALVSERPLNKEANQRPDSLDRFITAQLPIASSWCNRAPSDCSAIMIT